MCAPRRAGGTKWGGPAGRRTTFAFGASATTGADHRSLRRVNRSTACPAAASSRATAARGWPRSWLVSSSLQGTGVASALTKAILIGCYPWFPPEESPPGTRKRCAGAGKAEKNAGRAGRPALGRVSALLTHRLRSLGVLAPHLGHGASVCRLRVLLAGVLRVARQIVALLLRHVVLRVGADLLRFLLRARGVLVPRVEVGIRNLAVALRLHFADVLGVTAELVAFLLRRLVLGLDAVLLGLVGLAVHLVLGKGGAGRGDADRGERGGDAGTLQHNGASSCNTQMVVRVSVSRRPVSKVRT